MAAEQQLDRHEARLQNHDKRLETQEVERRNKRRISGSQPPDYLPEAQASSTRQTQPPQSVHPYTETCLTSAPKDQHSRTFDGRCFPRNSSSSGASETQSQYTIEVMKHHIAATDIIIMLTVLVHEWLLQLQRRTSAVAQSEHKSRISPISGRR